MHGAFHGDEIGQSEEETVMRSARVILRIVFLRILVVPTGLSGLRLLRRKARCGRGLLLLRGGRHRWQGLTGFTRRRMGGLAVGLQVNGRYGRES